MLRKFMIVDFLFPLSVDKCALNILINELNILSWGEKPQTLILIMHV